MRINFAPSLIFISVCIPTSAFTQNFTSEKNGIYNTINRPGTGDFHRIIKATLNSKTGNLIVLAERGASVGVVNKWEFKGTGCNINVSCTGAWKVSKKAFGYKGPMAGNVNVALSKDSQGELRFNWH